jgi:digeranylgeranylglycerophospholipid reductase
VLKSLTIECDVLVVGAGPAGLAASITASKYGLNTILIEKNPEIGYPAKSSAFTWKEVIEEWNIPENAVSQCTDSFYIHSAHTNEEVEIDFGEVVGGTLNFHIFLQELAFRAIRAGSKINVFNRAVEPIIKNDTVIGVKTKTEDIISKIVIDCSGPQAVIAKKVGFLESNSRIMGIGAEYEMLNVKIRNQNSIDFFVGKSEVVPVGYGWIFPTGEKRAKVGVATVINAPEDIDVKNITHYLDSFLSYDSPIYDIIKSAQPFEFHSGVYPLTGPIEKDYGNGFMVAGDAAAQASMLLGEGIRYALEFGKRAAETASEAIEANDFSEDFLYRYHEKCQEYLGETFKVAADLLQVPTDEYWESVIESLVALKKIGNKDLILKYLKTDLSKEEAIQMFPTFKGEYF